jgi:hypothetical protein|tara:strand:- start:2277 stop:2579 length:303 start_codon:yes stop_codon:yes gene_type:complete
MDDKEDKSKKKIVKATIDLHSEEVLKEAIRKVVTEKVRKRHTNDELEAMVSTCSEFLKAFIVLGYDFEGNSIKPIFYAKSDLDADALGQLIQKFFITTSM